MRTRKEVSRLHETGGRHLNTEGTYEPERIMARSLGLHGPSSEHQTHKPASSRVPKNSVNSYVAPHKTGGQTREPHFWGSLIGAALPLVSHLLGHKKGGSVTEKDMEKLRNNPAAMKELRARHKELSCGARTDKEEREHHFLGSLIRGGMKALKPMIKPMMRKGMEALAPHAGNIARKGMAAVESRMSPGMKKLASSAAPLARTGIGMLENKSKGFAKGMSAARQGASAMGFSPSFKKGGKVRSKHAAGAIAKKRLDQY